MIEKSTACSASRDTTPLSKQFDALFMGYRKAYGQFVVKQSSDTGKMEGQARTIRGDFDDTKWEKFWDLHITGKGSGLGVVPLTEDNKSHWGALDIDILNINHAALEEKVTKLGLPLIVARSKSGGAHLYVFFTESVPADELMDLLSTWSGRLGYGGCETFPKQSHRTSEQDIGNWLNMPYNGEYTSRYAVIDGKDVTAKEFVDKALEMRVSFSDALKLKDDPAKENTNLFEEGPPCLQQIEAWGGFGEGTRNDGMFAVAVYLKKRFPDNWPDMLMEYNYKLCDPALPNKEIIGLIKSVKKKDYHYKCRQEPIRSFCNSNECTKRRYGINSDEWNEGKTTQTHDWGTLVAEQVLHTHFRDGEYLIRDQRTFFKFIGTHWVKVEEDQIRNVIEPIAQTLYHPKKSSSVVSLINAGLSIISARSAKEIGIFNTATNPQPIVNCRNGELWIADDGSYELKEHSPDSRLTYCLDVDFEPNADCPEFKQALSDMFGENEDMIRHMWEVIGYLIQPHRPFAAWFLFVGTGANGKSALVETIEQLLGPDATVSLSLRDFENSRFNIAQLIGKLMFKDDDVDTGTILPDGLLKKISERKRLTGEIKYGGHITFENCATPVLLANNYPISRDISVGLLRRAVVIPFSERFYTTAEAEAEKAKRAQFEVQGNLHDSGSILLKELERDGKPLRRDPDRPIRIADPGRISRIQQTECAGILATAVKALERVLKRRCFEEPNVCLAAKNEWKAAANPLLTFLDEICEFGVDGSGQLPRISVSDLYKEFLIWCEEMNIRKTPTQTSFTQNIRSLNINVTRNGGQRYVDGIRVRKDWQNDI